MTQSDRPGTDPPDAEAIRPDPDREARLRRYFAFAEARPDLFGTPADAIRILMDPADILAVETATYRRMLGKGFNSSEAAARSSVGIVLDDPWLYVVRDAVEFPDGSRRTHTRTLNYVGDGVAVLPIFEGRIVLTRQFRHAARKFVLEIPRGGIEKGQTPETAARAELSEEIGGTAGELVHLGYAHGSTNLYANGVVMYLAHLDRIGEPQLHEGIVALDQFAVPEFERRLLAGDIVDSFTLAAYAYARLRGLI